MASKLLIITEIDGEDNKITRKELVTTDNPLRTVSRDQSRIVEKCYTFSGVGEYVTKILGTYRRESPQYDQLNRQLLIVGL